MRVAVKLVSPLNLVPGRKEPFAVELADGATATDLVPIVAERVKHLPHIHGAVLAGGLMFLVNGAYSSPDVVLRDGDRVSVVLRISGI